MNSPIVSVIVPIYNVAPYIQRCVRSLMLQSLRDVEFIFVDDASPDDSIELAKKEVARFKRDVRFLVHPENRGLPAARNTGMAEALGKYIYHCDSDDYLEPNALEILYKTAKANDADFVYSDFYLDFGTNRRYMDNPDYVSADIMIKDGFLAGKMKYNVWNKLIKRDLYKNIAFPEGHSMGEDMTIIRLATKVTHPVHVKLAMYHWMKDNADAFSFHYSPRHLEDLQFNVQQTIEYLQENWDTKDKERYIAYFRLGIKLPFLLSGEKRLYRLWRSWYPESNHYIWSNTTLPVRTRMVQLLAKWRLYSGVRLYAKAINKHYQVRYGK